MATNSAAPVPDALTDALLDEDAIEFGPDSTTMPAPRPRMAMPKLDDFYFKHSGTKLPSSPPPNCESEKEITIHAVHRLLQWQEHESDIALELMIKHKVLQSRPYGTISLQALPANKATR